jgi:hypothetical protein
VKVPLYSLLGISGVLCLHWYHHLHSSVCFALTFSVLDVLNSCVGYFGRSGNAAPLVQSPKQVSFLVLCSTITLAGLCCSCGLSGHGLFVWSHFWVSLIFYPVLLFNRIVLDCRIMDVEDSIGLMAVRDKILA